VPEIEIVGRYKVVVSSAPLPYGAILLTFTTEQAVGCAADMGISVKSDVLAVVDRETVSDIMIVRVTCDPFLTMNPEIVSVPPWVIPENPGVNVAGAAVD
jgi:hypothetical protein